MGNRGITALATGLVLALGAATIGVVMIVGAVDEEMRACVPQVGVTAEQAVGDFDGDVSAPIEGQVGVAQANIPMRAGRSGFARSMPRVLSTRPDFVSLNEQTGRSLKQIEAAAPGYAAYRDPAASGQVASTVVLWNAERWERVDAGRVELVEQGPQRWDAGRSATWVTARGPGGAVVSVVSVHHMINPAKFGPNKKRRQQLYGQGMRTLLETVGSLANRGPVFVAGDMNTHAGQKQPWAAAPQMQKAGYGWVNDGVDFVFYPRSLGVRPARSWSGPMASDHDWVAARFDMNGVAASGAKTASHAADGGRTVAGLDAEQTRNAATIIEVGRRLQVPERGLVVALATALQESGLRNLDHGDRDSLGLFQQRPSTGWGTAAQLQDPAAAAAAFFGGAEHTDNAGLLDIDGWESMSVAAAAQAVQRSAFPSAYADDESRARHIVAQLDSGAAETLAAATQSSYCADGLMLASSGGVCPPTGAAAEEGLRPDALMVLRCVEATFGPNTYGGVGERAANPASDHPSGRAVDVMIEDWQSAEGIARGDAIAAWLQQHHRELGITYLIWRGRIWSPGDSSWRPYDHPSGAGDPTSAHMDHVHVSVEGNAGSGMSTEVAMPLPAGSFTDQDNYRSAGGSWSRWHSGNDLSAPCGTPVLAAHGGTIIVERDQGWSGPWLVKVSTGPNQPTTWYAHMESVTVQPGQQVTAGQQIGTVGNEGNSHGCHLHLELHLRNGSIYGPDNTDPMPWLRQMAAAGGPDTGPAAG